MRIIEYPTAVPSNDDYFVMEGVENGTHAVSAPTMAKTLLKMNGFNEYFEFLDGISNVVARRNTFRGKNLGNVVTDEQKANIKNGSFRGFFLGDYWTINERNWRIVDFDYWLNTGNPIFNIHHLVVMPDYRLYTAPMNDTNTTVGGYPGSKMNLENILEAKGIFQQAFPNMILPHAEIFYNVISSIGAPESVRWMDSEVNLPSQVMILGYQAIMPGVYHPTTSKSQFALMRSHPAFIDYGPLTTSRQDYWLRDTASGNEFAVISQGGIQKIYASYTSGVRPVAAIGVSS